ncbi:hypothetical protein J2W14_000525 [Pseudarthrobacter oxydans]|nr:hypothetical protein [Pseudarthrobacter oxydans]MDP9981149.1 hypothetical protein [Pseudarthrobacter oxydans]
MTTHEPNHPPVPARNQTIANVCLIVQATVDVAGLVLAWWIHTK